MIQPGAMRLPTTRPLVEVQPGYFELRPCLSSALANVRGHFKMAYYCNCRYCNAQIPVMETHDPRRGVQILTRMPPSAISIVDCLSFKALEKTSLKRAHIITFER